MDGQAERHPCVSDVLQLNLPRVRWTIVSWTPWTHQLIGESPFTGHEP